MAYNYSKLIGRIVEKYGDRRAFAHVIGMSEASLSLRLNNKVPLKQSDIELMRESLEIPPEEINVYFFDKLLNLT